MLEPGELFASAAGYYARYRQPYDGRAFPAIVQGLDMAADSTVLDLGTGTGGVARGLAPFVGRVLAVDPSTDMLEVARTEGTPANVTWPIGDSAHLRELGLEQVDAVMMGRSFHWMDRAVVLAELDEFVSPGGGLALLRTLEPFGVDPVRPPWHAAVHEVIERYGLLPDRGYVPTSDHLSVLEESPFGKVERLTFEHGDVTLTLDEIVGAQFSYSYTSPRRLGDRREGFEADLRATLLAYEPSGHFPFGTVTTEVVLARRR